MNSALYEGAVRHRRFAERRGEFRHPLTMAYVDLDELPHLLGGMLVRRRPGIVRFRRADYLGSPAVPLGEAVRGLVEERTGRRPAGPVRVLTQLRSLGHCFNPVSFYFCFDAGERLTALVAEVTSTPWGERHAYVLEAEGDGVDGAAGKELHVSPFLDMDGRYRIHAAAPGDALRVNIETRARGERAFDATLALRRRELTRGALAAAVARHPAPTLRILALIYAHALSLWLRGVRVRPHPAAGRTA